MMCRAVLGILFFLINTPFLCESFAQTHQADDKAMPDTTLVNALIDSSYEYSFSNPDSAISFANRAMELSEDIGFKQGIASAHRELGYSWSVKGDFQKSLAHFKKGVVINLDMGDTLGLISHLNDLGNAYKKQSEYDKALKYYFESLGLCQAIGLERGISVNLGNIGLAYFEMDEDNKALEFYNRALEINRKLGKKQSLSSNYNNLGLLHGDQGNFQKAIEYHEKALKLRRELGYTIRIANSLNNLGRLYMQQKHYDNALDYLQEASEVNDGRDEELSTIIEENLAKTYLASGQYNLALDHARRTVNLSREYGSKLGMKVGYELLTDIYRHQGEYKRALTTQKNLMAVKDSILNSQKTRQINELQTKYETEKKEKEIALLEKEKEREALLRNAFLAGLILVTVIGILVYSRQKLKIKKNEAELDNKRLREQQLEQDIAFKNKQLTTRSLHLVQKNETMKELQENIDDIQQNDVDDINRKLQKLKNLVDYSFNLDEDWKEFKLYFEEVHTGFFNMLKEQYPDLTANELRLAALAKLNLSVKETATIMGITPDSVKTARYRLRKKLDIETEENLAEFMISIDRGLSGQA